MRTGAYIGLKLSWAKTDMKANYHIEAAGATEEILLTNGLIKAVVVPAQGGRVVELSREGANVLYRNPALLGKKAGRDTGEWLNFGGYKAWISPQSRWQWPPPFELDSGEYRYRVEAAGDGITIGLESIPSGALGLQLTREIRMEDDSERIAMIDTLKNLSDRTVSWGLWGNAQVQTPGHGIVKLHSDPYTGGVMFYQLFDFPGQEAFEISKGLPKSITAYCGGSIERYKIGMLTDQCEIEYHCTGCGKELVLTVTFEYQGDSGYPNHNNIEIYNDMSMPYAELEILGPVGDIEPEGSICLKQEWRLEEQTVKTRQP